MRLNRTARAAAVLAAAVGMATAYVPAASAHGSGTLDFVGTAALSGGLDYPCLAGPPGTAPKPCPPTTTVDPTPTKKTADVRVSGNTRTGTFTNNTGQCVATVVNAPDKLGNKTPGPKPPTEGPGCRIQATFSVTGHCGLSWGTGTGSGTVTTLLPTAYNNNFWFNFTWTSTPGGLTVRGNYWKTGPTKPATPEGDIVATVTARPLTDTEAGQRNSCLDKTADQFQIVGTAELVHPKATP